MARWLNSAVVVLAALPVVAGAQSGFPSRPITMVMPFGTGSNSDLAGRTIASEASKLLGQPVVYENRPGASARLGVAAMKNAKPDGHLVSFAIDGLLVSQPLADPEFKLEVEKDYAPIALVMEYPLVLAAQPGVPFRDMKGLLAYARANPGRLNFAIGNASSSHFLAELFRQAADINLTLVPYKGSAQAQGDLLAGRVDMTALSTTAKPHIDAGKLFAVATSGRERWRAFPNVPTFLESGVPLTATVWFGVIAPAGTPRDVVLKWNSALNEVLKGPVIQKQYAEWGFLTRADNTPEAFVDHIRAEMKTWGPVIRKAGIRLE